MNTGTLYGVGIGPGDPKLMTFRAAELIRDNEIIADRKSTRLNSSHRSLSRMPSSA